MKKLNLFSNLWRLFRGSQKDDGSNRLRVVFDSFTCRLRVWPLKLVSVLAILLTVGVGNVWGTTYNFSSIPNTGWSTNGGSQTINSISWTYSSSTYIGENSSKIQVGSKNNPQTSAWTIQTAVSNFGSGKKVTSIAITAYTTATTATYDISAGGSSVKSGSLTTSSSTYTASSLNVTSGDIVVTLTGSSTSKAMYLSNISVTYDDAGSSYTLTFKDPSGSTNGSTTSISANATTFSFGSTAPSKTGHHIDGFYKESSLTNKIADAKVSAGVVTGGNFCASTDYTDGDKKYTAAADHDLYLKWVADSYSVTATLTNTSASSDFPSSVTYTGSTTTALNRTLTASSGYALPTSITVTMGGSTLTKGTHYSWNSGTGAFTFDVAVTGAIVITVTSSIVYTVSFSTGTGNPSQDALTEASGGAGITLPNIIPACSGDGWLLYGWKTTAALASETATAPTIVGKPGDTYKPSGNITLYAVYAKGEYTKETSSITAGGKYIIAANSSSHNYVMTNDYQKPGDYGQLKGKLIDETTTNKYHAANVHADYVFTIVTSSSVSVSSGDWMIKNIVDNKYVSPDFKNFYVSTITNADGNTITWNSGNSGWDIVNVYGSTNMLQYDAGNNLFISASPATSLLIYKETTTPKYNSAPECCTPLGQPATLTLDKTAYTITATWTATSDGNETGYSVQLYDNSGGEKGDAIEDPVSRTSSQLTYTFGAKTPVGSRLTANHKYYVGVTPTYSGAGDYCTTGTEKLVSVTTNQVYTVTYHANGGTVTTLPSGGTYEEGDEVTVAAKPATTTKSGHSFTGWNTNSAGGVATHYDADGTTTFDMPAANVTLYAEWTTKKDYYIDRMHGNWDGEHTVEVNGVVYNCYLREGAGYTRPTLTDNEGGSNSCVTGHSHFLGWVLDSKIGAQGQLLTGYTIYAGGSSGTSSTDGTVYWAVWAEDEE